MLGFDQGDGAVPCIRGSGEVDDNQSIGQSIGLERGVNQPAALLEATETDEQARRPRRVAKPAASDTDNAEKPKSRTVKANAQPDVVNTEADVAATKAPAKRVRKAGTTDAPTS